MIDLSLAYTSDLTKNDAAEKKNVRKKKVEKYEHEKTSASGPHRYLASHSRQLKLLIEEE